jgi:hypothetical protein
MRIVAAIVWLLTIGVAAFLLLYVTYLFVHRLRRREPPFKSFLIWLRDLFDVASGLG